MGKAALLRQVGEQNELKIQDIETKKRKEGQILVKNIAIGVNEDDVFANMKFTENAGAAIIPGYSASGDIVEIGANVSGFTAGDSVVYLSKNMGCYQEYCVVNESDVISLPESTYPKTAAAVYFSGMTAHALVKRVFFIRPGMAVMIHNATSGIGHILAQWANISGAIVIGGVDDDDKRDFALKHGCHKVVNYSSGVWHKEVLDITQNQGVNVVYDQGGAESFEESLKCVTKMGLMVCYGTKAQLISPLDVKKLAEKSLYITFPSIFDYKANRMELLLSANDVFSMISSGKIKVQIDSEYSLDNIEQAYQKLRSNKIKGSVIAYI